MSINRHLFKMTVFLAVVCLFPNSRLSGRDAEADLKRIVEEWDKKRAAAMTVRYEVTGDAVIPKGIYNEDVDLPADQRKGDYPPADHRYEKTIKLALDFGRNHYRREVREQIFNGSRGKFEPRYAVQTYDGERSRSYFPKSDNPEKPIGNEDINLGSSDLSKFSGTVVEWDELPMLIAHGVIRHQVHPQNLRATVAADQLRVHGYAVKDSREHLVLRTLPNRVGHTDEMWVDIERGATITRWKTFRPGLIFAALEIDYHQLNGHWIPLSWTTTLYRGAELIDATYRNRVVKFTMNEPIGLEELQLERLQRPGMTVRMAERGDELLQVQNDGSLSPLQFGPDGEILKPSPWRWWAIAGALAICVTGVIVWFWRRRLRMKRQGISPEP
jgi:hypothetical protein